VTIVAEACDGCRWACLHCRRNQCESRCRNPSSRRRTTWTHSRVRVHSLCNGKIRTWRADPCRWRDWGRTGHTAPPLPPLRFLHGTEERLAPPRPIGLDDDSVAGFKLNTEHAPSGGRVEQAAYGDSAQFSGAEGLEDCREEFGFVGAENVTTITPAPFPPQRSKWSSMTAVTDCTSPSWQCRPLWPLLFTEVEPARVLDDQLVPGCNVQMSHLSLSNGEPPTWTRMAPPSDERAG